MATRGWNFTLDEFSDRMGSIARSLSPRRNNWKGGRVERRGRRGSFNWSRSFEMESKRRCKRIAVYPSRGRNTVIVILIESEGEGKVRRNAPALTRPLERRPRSRASVLIKWKSRVIERSPPFQPHRLPSGDTRQEVISLARRRLYYRRAREKYSYCTIAIVCRRVIACSPFSRPFPLPRRNRPHPGLCLSKRSYSTRRRRTTTRRKRRRTFLSFSPTAKRGGDKRRNTF